MGTWKSKLQNLVTSKQRRIQKKEEEGDKSKEERRKRLDHFFDSIVLPAFRELERELRGSHPHVQARIDREPYQVTLSVYHDDEREFYYTIREVRHHGKTFAFPQIVRPDEPKDWRVQVVLPGKERKIRNPKEFTKEGLIDDFLSNYEKCPGL